MSDPRERIETGGLLCEGNDDRWGVYGGHADWPEVVELAQKILAADAAWKDATVPTLAKLRTKYPGFNFNVQSVVCGPTYCEVAWVTLPDGTNEGNHFESEAAALRWLAAKLEELGDGKLSAPSRRRLEERMPKYDVIYPQAKAGETGTSGGAVIARFFDRGICACGSPTHWHRYPDDVHPVPTCSTECESALAAELEVSGE